MCVCVCVAANISHIHCIWGEQGDVGNELNWRRKEIVRSVREVDVTKNRRGREG